MELTAADKTLVAALQAGLPLVAEPYAEIGRRIGWTERQVLDGIARLQAGGCINRMGVVVRHHELGYNANAMVVWNVPDADIDRLGEVFSRFAFVTLCYRRPRREGWPYNLFCMIHGRDRAEVLAHVDALRAAAPAGVECDVLFSKRRFKQRGAHYAPARGAEHGRA